VGCDKRYPELVAAISSEIYQKRTHPFVRFMELALYHPVYGYYMRQSDSVEHEAYRLVRRFLHQLRRPSHSWPRDCRASQTNGRSIGCPAPFTIVEMGAGKGVLAEIALRRSMMIKTICIARPLCPDRAGSPVMRNLPAPDLAPWLGKAGLVTWMKGLDRLGPQGVTGLLFSNELIDAFPVHRVQSRTDGLKSSMLIIEMAALWNASSRCPRPRLLTIFSV